MSDEAVVLTVVGKNEGIKEKAQGWHEVEVSVPGKQYPVKLATKRTQLIEDLRATIGKMATFTYTEKDSTKINPNSGNPYKNRYLESVEAGGTPGTGTASGSGGGDADRMTKEEWNAKDRRDYRSRAWAQTISAYAHTIKAEDDVEITYQRLKAFQERIYRDIVRDLDDGTDKAVKPPEQPQPQAPPPAASEPSGDHEQQYDDDDIPF